MKFRTELNNIQAKSCIKYSDKILCIGSCFAEHIHHYLTKLKYNSFLNPCGIAYNPISSLNSLKYASKVIEANLEELNEHNGVFSHPDFHSEFSSTKKKDAFKNITTYLENSFSFSSADVLILSLGTAFVYEDAASDKVVNNCHKLPSSRFKKRLLSLDEVRRAVKDIVDLIRKNNPQARIIGTVSPVRHLRDGMVNNNRSKATLHLALSEENGLEYFPSYELLLDDLRDYRFYAKDLIHPSDEAISYILEFFTRHFLKEEEGHFRKKVSQIQKDLEHRPFFPESREHQAFLNKVIEKMKEIGSEDIDFSTEIASLKAQIE